MRADDAIAEGENCPAESLNITQACSGDCENVEKMDEAFALQKEKLRDSIVMIRRLESISSKIFKGRNFEMNFISSNRENLVPHLNQSFSSNKFSLNFDEDLPKSQLLLLLVFRICRKSLALSHNQLSMGRANQSGLIKGYHWTIRNQKWDC